MTVVTEVVIKTSFSKNTLTRWQPTNSQGSFSQSLLSSYSPKSLDPYQSNVHKEPLFQHWLIKFTPKHSMFIQSIIFSASESSILKKSLTNGHNTVSLLLHGHRASLPRDGSAGCLLLDVTTGREHGDGVLAGHGHEGGELEGLCVVVLDHALVVVCRGRSLMHLGYLAKAWPCCPGEHRWASWLRHTFFRLWNMNCLRNTICRLRPLDAVLSSGLCGKGGGPYLPWKA